MSSTASLRGWQFVSLILFGSLFALTGLRQFFVDPIENDVTNVIWFVCQVLPLVVVLPRHVAQQRQVLVFCHPGLSAVLRARRDSCCIRSFAHDGVI